MSKLPHTIWEPLFDDPVVDIDMLPDFHDLRPRWWEDETHPQKPDWLSRPENLFMSCQWQSFRNILENPSKSGPVMISSWSLAPTPLFQPSDQLWEDSGEIGEELVVQKELHSGFQ